MRRTIDSLGSMDGLSGHDQINQSQLMSRCKCWMKEAEVKSEK